MEFIIGMALILAINEWRDFKSSGRFSVLKKEIEEMKSRQEALFLVAKSFEQIQLEFKKLNEQLLAQSEFISKAQVDLATIVNEYEVNGIPLGYDRGRKFDMVEGL